MARYNFGEVDDLSVGPNSYDWQISDLQKNLFDYGISVNTTGVYDAETGAAVARFQVENGLPVTGQADNNTVAKLIALAAAHGPPPKNPANKQYIRADEIEVFGNRPGLPWWVYAGGIFAAWKILT